MMLIIATIGYSQQSKPITGDTGDPVLFEKGGQPIFRTFSEEEYKKRLDDYRASKEDVVEIKRKPENLPASVRYGFNPVDGRQVSWIIDGDDETGYTLYEDLNANGDLTDDAPMHFEKHDDHYSLIFKTTGKAMENGKPLVYPIIFKMQV